MNPSWQRAVAGPAIHALVIGVGSYPFVGAQASNSFLRRLRSLSSPPLSAVRLAEHLSSAPEFAPRIASIDLLVSQGTAVPAGWTTRAPTRANIDAAFNAWKARGDAREQDTLLFYFCGHGYQKAELMVMPEDIGANPGNPLVNAIDMTQTKLAMSQARARTHLWLVDACREAPREVVEALGAIGSPLMLPEPRGYAGLDSTMLSATTDFQLAYGPPGAISLFADALLAALRGAAARRVPGGRWVIRTGNLQQAINEHLRTHATRQGQVVQQCECLAGTGMSELVEFAVPPPVRVRVDCDPTSHHTDVELNLRNSKQVVRRAPNPGPWDTEVHAGVWNLSATSNSGHIPSVEQDCWFEPPTADEVLRWQK